MKQGFRLSAAEMKRRIRAGFAKEVRAIDLDLRLMRRIETDITWLLNRDSNCGLASSLCDAIHVLIKKAIDYHLEERASAVMSARTGQLRRRA